MLERGRRMLSEEFFPAERRDQFIFRGKKVGLVYLLVRLDNEHYAFILSRSSLNAKNTTITKRPFAGSLTISNNGLMNPIVALLILLKNMLKGSRRYVFFFSILALFLLHPIPGIKLEACNQWTPNPPWTFRKLQIFRHCHRRHQCSYWWRSSWPGFERLVQVHRRLYPQGIVLLFYYIYTIIHCLIQVLLEPGYLLESACNDQGNRLRETGRQFYDVKYRDHFNNFFNSVGDWFKAMGEDPVRYHIPSS